MSNGQIHNTNTALAGMISQETIKLVTNQFKSAV